MGKPLRRVSALGLLVVSFVLAYLVIRNQPHVEHFLRSIGPGEYPLAVAIFALVASAPFSVTDALAIMNGAIFGPLWGSVVNAIGLVIAALLGYWINRRASHLLDLDDALKKLPAWVKRFPIGSPMFLLAVRVIPGLGGTVATATAATFKVPVWVHVWTMCAIAIPLCTLLAIFGDGVTVAIHNYEHRMHLIELRARVYYEHHHPHLHWRLKREAPLPKVMPT